jgi:hypothetical protein
VVKNDLFNFGFIIAEEKSNWNPVQESIWLDLIWYTVEGKIPVTQDRIDKILSCSFLSLKPVTQQESL